jgi:uncharacterized protein (DUF885 family)
MRKFYSDWLAALEKLDADKLSEAGRADRKRLQDDVRSALRQLDVQAKAQAEVAPLLPFAPTVIDLEEARRRMERVDAAKAAGLLNDLKKQIDRTRQGIEAGLKSDGKAFGVGLTKNVTGRAAETTASLRNTLKNWYGFYNAYDPIFTWWMGEPYKEADRALEGYAAFLRETCGNGATGGERALLDKGQEPPDPVPARFANPSAKETDVPDLDELLAFPQSELRGVVQRYQTDRRNLSPLGSLRGRTPAPPRSPEQLARMKKLYSDWIAALRKLDFDRLSQEGRIDYLLLKNHAECEIRRLDLQAKLHAEIARLVPFEPAVLELDGARRRKEKIDPDKAVSLLEDLKKQIDRAREGIEPEQATVRIKADPALVPGALATVDALKAALKSWFDEGDGSDTHFSKSAGKAFREAEQALQSYAAFLRDRFADSRPRDESGITGRPVGREALRIDLDAEMIPYAPEELIVIAEKEMAWCEAEMRRASRDLGFGDDWHKAVEKVKTLHVEPGRQPELIRDLAREAIDYLDKHGLVTVPHLARETWRMEMTSPQRQLVNPFFTGGEVISVSFPTNTMSHEAKLQSMRGNNVHFSRATVHHELIPGHHLQGFMTARYQSHRGPFSTPFWGEGWALYWEMVLYDMTFPKSPEDRVGFLFWRMHRCARIIFSLNFHLGKWSAQECIDYLVKEVGHERDNATAEVRRSFAGGYSPLYQAAYMLGGLQIRALRKELVDSGTMTNRAFHDAILKEGRMPIEMVRASLTKQPLSADFSPGWKFYGPKPTGAHSPEVQRESQQLQREKKDTKPKVTEVPEAVRERYHLDKGFYKKHLDYKGFSILGSAKVSDEALFEARYLIDQLLGEREDILNAMIKSGCRFMVMAPTEMTTDVPEQRNWDKAYWDKRARGMGGKLSSCGEENLLNLKGDRYNRENILIHEFNHAIHQQGLRKVDPTFDSRLKEIYQKAMDKGLWKDTYVATNRSEYWAEGVQAYFDCMRPQFGANTREKLEKYDPDLFKLVDEVYKQSKFRYVRYDKRNPPASKTDPSEPKKDM